MSDSSVGAAKRFFNETWAQHCSRTPTRQGIHELKFLFRQTLAHAIAKGATWDPAAQRYISPKLQELATRVQNAPEDHVTDAVIERESTAVINKYRPGSGTPSWCAAYAPPPVPHNTCSDLQDATKLFYETFHRHCDKLDSSGRLQLDFIFKRTVRHALCVLGKGWDPEYVSEKLEKFAREVQASHHATVDDVKLHDMISRFIVENRALPEERLVWCVDYPQAEREG
jgi:hypothetical protein